MEIKWRLLRAPGARPARPSTRQLRQVRAAATCYDKREYSYQGTIDVASIRAWLRDPVR